MKHDYRLFVKKILFFRDIDCNSEEFNLKIFQSIDVRRMSNENVN